MKAIDILPWDESFNTGIAVIDEQHRKLVALLNRLASQVAYQSDNLPLSEVFDELVAYAAYHFETEEAIWNQHLGTDASAVEHHDSHQQFVRQVVRLRREHETVSRERIVDEVLVFLTRWLAAHILDSDRTLAHVVRGRLDGLSLAEAKHAAAEHMLGNGHVLVGVIQSVFQALSINRMELMRELAERKQREAELLLARSDAERAGLARSRFLSDMSQEIRAPLNGILGMAQLLRDADVSADERNEFAETIEASGNELLARLTGMLELAALESGAPLLAKDPFDPADVLAAVRDGHIPMARVRGVRLECRNGLESSVSYVGDERRLCQMLGHLVDNALKFGGNGGVIVSIAPWRSAAGDGLEFSVEDQGPGVDPAKVRQIFQPFRQADDSRTRKYAGAGIGLAVVTGYAQLMQGQAGYDPGSGGGARFWFRIPAVAI